MYAVGVVHGMLRARQMFGAVGLSQSYPIDGSTFMHAIESLMAALPSDNSNPATQFVCDMLTSVSGFSRYSASFLRELTVCL